ncbi:MAG TPA: S8 family peptidase [Bacteroidia bacterium]|nr:S8 family peptidase [Bacteroidia bacterium]
MSSFSAYSQRDESAVSNEFIVLINTGTEISSVMRDENLSAFITEKSQVSKSPNVWLLKTAGGNDDAMLAALKKNPEIIIAQKNHRFEYRTAPNDALYALSQWNMNNTGQTGGTPGADISAELAWNITTGGLTSQGDSIVIAIIDCGFYLPHADLNFWKNYHEIPGDNIDNDNNGYMDDYDGWHAGNNDGNITSCNHGTHVAGIAGAIGNNSIGVTGVNWNVKIMPVQPSSSTEAFVVGAYSYVFAMRKKYNLSNGDSGAFVVSTNSSFGVNFGQPANYPLWCAMYDSLGSVGILSAGAGPNLSQDVDVIGDMPTGCVSDWLISVTNTNSSDVLNSNACWGDTTIDLGAPGTTVMSTYPSPSDYNVSTGTSMATPHVAGAVALMWAAACDSLLNMYRTNPASVALLVKQIMLQSVDTLSNLQSQVVSNGRLNLYQALLGVQNYCLTLPVQSPDSPEESIRIFPNPAGKEIKVQKAKGKIESVEVWDLFGKKCLTPTLSKGEGVRIDVSSLPAGMYFVKMKTEKGIVVTKIVIER